MLATHEQKYQCQELGLKPWNSFGEAIDNLEANAPNHLIAHPRRVRNKRTRKPQHRPDWPLEETITTGATWPLHYSGEFLCTLREGACLQALPRDYEFRGPFDAIKKQVANTVPPPAAKAILESVKRCLMQTDASRRS